MYGPAFGSAFSLPAGDAPVPDPEPTPPPAPTAGQPHAVIRVTQIEVDNGRWHYPFYDRPE